MLEGEEAHGRGILAEIITYLQDGRDLLLDALTLEGVQRSGRAYEAVAFAVVEELSIAPSVVEDGYMLLVLSDLGEEDG